MASENLVRKNFYIDQNEFDQLNIFATKRGVSTSAVLRLVIKKFNKHMAEKASTGTANEPTTSNNG